MSKWGSSGVIAIIVAAFGLMLGLLKLADAFKRIGVIVEIDIALLNRQAAGRP
ncbi:MAG: hypothetical protein ACLQMO_15175 [Acidobacteriaceae bacterium]